MSKNTCVLATRFSILSTLGILIFSGQAQAFQVVISNPLKAASRAKGVRILPYWDATHSNFYQNTTAAPQVVTSVDFDFSAAQYGISNTSLDICFDSPPVGQQAHTITNEEVICSAMHLGTGEWPKTHWHVDFPGQGFLLSPGQIASCDSSGGVKGVPRHPVWTPYDYPGIKRLWIASDFSCTMNIEAYNPDAATPAVRSVRVPFADEAFRGVNSRPGMFHTGRYSIPLHTMGTWIYSSASGAAVTSHITLSQSGVQSTGDVEFDANLGNGWRSQDYWQPFDTYLTNGDSFSWTCSIPTMARRKKICAFYTMVAAYPTDATGQTHYPSHPSDTIDPSVASEYCSQNASHRSRTILSEKIYTVPDVCRTNFVQ